MCGIVGYVGRGREAQQVLLDGLRRLEYRGYDSAGVADLRERHRSPSGARSASSRTSRPCCATARSPGRVGVGHTRWATHGKPSERNAHPHKAGSVVVVHNGIMENYRELRAELEATGREIASDTDTELIAHLIDARLRAGVDLVDGRARGVRARGGLLRLRRALARRTPTTSSWRSTAGARSCSGSARSESFLASDIPAILPYTRQMLFLEDGEFAVLSDDGVQVLDRDGRPIDREPRADPVGPGLGGEGRLRPLHAEGDLRAAARDHRHDRHARARGRGRPRPRRHRLLAGASRASSASRSSPAAPPGTPASSAST